MSVRIGLVQINNDYSGQSYLPYSVGLLQAYFQKYAKNPKEYEFMLPLHRRAPVKEGAAQFDKADIVAFSVYVWNVRLSLEIAKEIKKRNPKVLIVMGGPQVPNATENFLRENPVVDLAVNGEGEPAFLAILETFKTKKWETVPSLSFIDKMGKFVQTPKSERLKDLSVIPSPYLNGVFLPLMKAFPESNWLAIWETNRGCPFSCTFCDWGSATASKVFKFDEPRLLEEAEWFGTHKIPFVFCADANFGILARDVDIVKKVSEVKRNTGFPQALSVQSSKNTTERNLEIQQILYQSGLNKSATISFQSRDEETLKNIKRGNISQKTYQTMQKKFTVSKIPTYTDIILGLPGETYDSFADGVSVTIDDGQHNRIVFNNCSILPNAEMGDPKYQKEHGLEVITNEVVYIRGSIHNPEGYVPERQELIIATKTLSREEWRRTRVFAWMTNLIHFSKLFQIPSILLHECYSLSYREIIEIFTQSPINAFSTLAEIRKFFHDKALAIQNGDYEFCPSKEWLGIYWPADEYIWIKLCTENKLEKFYEEAEAAVMLYLKKKSIEISREILHEAISFNRALVKLPFMTTDISFDASYDFWSFYNGVISGNPVPLEERKTRYLINRTKTTWKSWEEWYREVVWFGNKTGAYIYNPEEVESTEYQIAGHY